MKKLTLQIAADDYERVFVHHDWPKSQGGFDRDMSAGVVLRWIVQQALTDTATPWCWWQLDEQQLPPSVVDEYDAQAWINQRWHGRDGSCNPYGSQRCLEVVSVAFAREHTIDITYKGCAFDGERTVRVNFTEDRHGNDTE